MPFIELQPPDRHSLPPATIEQNSETGMSFRALIPALNAMLSELFDAVTPVEGPVTVPTYTVETLPESIASTIIYVSDGAAGGPILAFGDGTIWRRSDTGEEVAAS